MWKYRRAAALGLFFAVGCASNSTSSGVVSVAEVATTSTSTSTTSTTSTTVLPTSTLPPAPPAEPTWIGGGVPAAGSVFRSFSGDSTIAGKHRIALTFDDGPTQYTAPILDILKQYGVHATFFMISPQAKARPEVVKRIVAEGNRIGAHTRTHPHLTTLTPEQQRDEVVGSVDDIESVAGPGSVKCLRPSFGEWDNATHGIAKERNISLALWSLDTNDWKKPGWQAILTRVQQAADNDVVLMHDGGGDRTGTVDALKWLIPVLLSKGYTFVTVC